jgi:pimeloyl-ACP methyl ester carboxylesterase
MNFLCVLCVLLRQFGAATAAPPETVILIHGLGRTPLSMFPLAWKLRRAGYHVVNFRYPSRRFPIERLSEDYLAQAVAAQTAAGSPRIHFVTHSLGGILVRQYLSEHTMTNLGCVVMLAPPNHGSKLVDRIRTSAIGRWILGPAGCELGTGPANLPERLGPPRFPLGIIAASRDGKVPVASAQLAGMADFLVVPGFHTWITCRRETSRAVLAFLANGQFAH